MPSLRRSIPPLLLALSYLATSPAPAQANQPLERTLTALSRQPAVARAHWGISVLRLNGTVAADIDAGQFFQPASTAKLFTTAAAMALLPMDECLHTHVLTFGSFTGDGTLVGELQIVGVGDSNLSGRPIPYQASPAGTAEPKRNQLRYIDELADGIQSSGITHITHGIVGVGFSAEPYPTGWEIDDAPWYYGAPVSALMVADNALSLTLTPAPISPGPGTVTVTIDPPLPYYTLQSNVTTSPGLPTRIDIDRPIGSKTVRIGGHIGTAPYTQFISIDNPPEYAALALKAVLQARGIAVDGPITSAPFYGETPKPDFDEYTRRPLPALQPLTAFPSITERFPPCVATRPTPPGTGEQCIAATHIGPQLFNDIVVINKNSQNLHAEAMLRQLAMLQGNTGFGSTAQGARVVRAFLTTRAAIDGDDFIFYDGSGLSSHDLVTPRASTQLLRFANTQPWGARWKSSLPIGGIDGSLRHRFTEAPLLGKIIAKTGTLGEARALSGYLQCRSGNTVAFSIMVTGHTPLNTEDEAVMDRMVAAIAAAE